MPGGREAVHVEADLGDNDPGAELADAGDRGQEPDGGAKGRRLRVDLPVDRGDRPVEGIDLVEMQPQQEAVVACHPSPQGGAKLVGRGLEATVEHGQHRGIGLALDERLEHRPAADAEHVGDHRVELDVGVLQGLLQPLGVARLLAHELLSWVRRRVRIASVAASGTKLARISPCASSSASQAASATSVLRPGTFLTCAAFARISPNPPSSSTCQTGFQ